MKVNVRLLAYRALLDMGNRHTDDVISDYVSKYILVGADRRFFMQLVNGVVEDRMLLDYYIDKLSKHKLSPEIRTVLRLGIYQVKRLNVPDYASVNECLNILDEIGETKVKGLVNAILRSFSRNQNIPLPKDKERRLSVYYSHPLWLVKYMIQLFGEEKTERILESNMKKPPLTLRVNSRHTTRDDYLQSLLKSGVEAEASEMTDSAITIKKLGGLKINELPDYDRGAFIVQDESSQLVVSSYPPKKDSVCIDVCASPGGKTTHMAEYADHVQAFDISKSRLMTTMKNITRLGLSEYVKLSIVDATKGVKELNDTADYVLVDAPCTALGTIRRNPDIKYNRIESDIRKNAKTQRIILKRASQYVRKDGILIYSTCTITKEENQDQVARFLNKNKEFELLLERQLFSCDDGTDGFYFAVMQRTEKNLSQDVGKESDESEV